MTTDELCRITVLGPDRRVDLAVPATTSVAMLLPVLVRHTAGQQEATLAGSSWVL